MRSFGVLCTIFLLEAVPALAQVGTAPPPAHISLVEGNATIDHDGESEAAVVNMPVLEGDRIRTGDGRVEVVFADGSAVMLDPDSEVEFLGGTRVRVVAGAIEHRAAISMPSASAQYLPSDLRPYGSDFDRYGGWQYEPSYGYVWYPTVAVDWRPYYYGYWAPLRPYGWTWIGYDAWAWPTHHYGRWGYARNRWFWIPGRTWAAAWVSWGTAPDYVSWCPLGYDGRPVVALSVGYRSSWNGWTVIPRERFGLRGSSAHHYAIEPHRLASTTPFVIHRSAPILDRRTVPYGVSRSTGIAVPRTVPQVGQPSSGRYGSDRAVYGWPGARIEREASAERGSGTTIEREASAERGRWPRRIGEGTGAPVRRPNGDARVIAPSAPPTAVYRIPGNGIGRSGDYAAPRAGDRTPNPSRSDQRAWTERPMTIDPRPAVRDHPAYRPNYAPRYEAARPYAVPRSEPRVVPPAGTVSPGVGGWRQTAPAPQGPAVAAPPPHAAPPSASARPSPAPAAGPPANRGGGANSRADGPAARRQRR
jgi:hypothetical protein